jgi:hypothetical protein
LRSANARALLRASQIKARAQPAQPQIARQQQRSLDGRRVELEPAESPRKQEGRSDDGAGKQCKENVHEQADAAAGFTDWMHARAVYVVERNT